MDERAALLFDPAGKATVPGLPARNLTVAECEVFAKDGWSIESILATKVYTPGEALPDKWRKAAAVPPPPAAEGEGA